jgi:muramoyltetrapeptide carboxypeptidase
MICNQTREESHMDQAGPLGSRPLLQPRPLRTGDAVGVVAASGPIEAEPLNAGLAFLNSKGFRVVKGCHVNERTGYLAGTDVQRCEDLNGMLRSDEIRAIVFARGGYGVMRLLSSVDIAALSQDPKILLGMSDVTALQLSLFQRCRLVSFAGPMVGQMGNGLDPLSEEWLTRSLTEPLAGRELLPGSGAALRVLQSGQACGPLLGGCLSLVTSLLGTSHCPDFTAAILLLEDVNEPPYRIDRMLTQLKLAGILDRLGGIVLGHFTTGDGTDISADVDEIVMELVQSSPMPVISGYPHGHVLPNLTVPIGATVELNTETPCLTIRASRFPELRA